MAKTPEGGIKAQVNVLVGTPSKPVEDIDVFMPVQMGYGKAGLDYHCAIRVRNTCVAFWIETKKTDANGVPSELTPRQAAKIKDLRERMRAKVFVIYNWAGVKELELWLTKMRSLG